MKVQLATASSEFRRQDHSLPVLFFFFKGVNLYCLGFGNSKLSNCLTQIATM